MAQGEPVRSPPTSAGTRAGAHRQPAVPRRVTVAGIHSSQVREESGTGSGGPFDHSRADLRTQVLVLIHPLPLPSAPPAGTVTASIEPMEVTMRTRVGLLCASIALVSGMLALTAVGQASGQAMRNTSSRVPVAGARSAAATEGVPSFGHVFLIIGENTTYSHLKLSNAPYLLGTIRPESAWLTNYYAATHWSQANYDAMVTGQFTRCEQQDLGISCHQNVDNLYHQMEVTGRTWKVWLEAGTAKCDTASGGSCSSNTACPLTGFYTTGNPPIQLDDIEGPNGVWSATTPSQDCLNNDVPSGTPKAPMSTLNSDLASGNVAAFNTIIPNGCEDGESNCKPVNNRYTQFDDFLAREVPKIQASSAYQHNGVIIILYDEDERAGGLAKKNGLGSGGHVACAIISPLVAPGSYSQKYYSYSVLRTLEDGFGISNYLGAANEVAPINNIWGNP